MCFFSSVCSVSFCVFSFLLLILFHYQKKWETRSRDPFCETPSKDLFLGMGCPASPFLQDESVFVVRGPSPLQGISSRDELGTVLSREASRWN